MQCVGWSPYDFELGKVLVILEREGLGGKWRQDGDWRVVAEVEVLPIYVDEYRDVGALLRFAEVAYERCLTLCTDSHGFSSSAAQRCIMSDDGCGELRPGILGDEDEWNFKGLVTVEELELTRGRGKLREVQYACHAERWKVFSSEIKVIEIAASVEAAQKKKTSLERSSAQMISNMEEMRTKLDKTRLAVQVG